MHLRLIILFLFSSFISFGQNGEYIHGRTSDDFGYSFTFNGKDGYVLVGSERVANDSSDHFSWRNIDEFGNVIWSRTWGGYRPDIPEHVERTSDGGYIIVGSRMEGGFQGHDGFLMKVDIQGKIEWTNYYGGNGRDELFSVKQTSDGGYILCGFSMSDVLGSYGQMFFVKTNPLGEEEWRTFAGGAGKDYGFDVIETSDGSFVATGVFAGFHRYSTFEFTQTHSDILVAKVSSSGTILWENTYGGIENELSYQVKEAPDQGLYVIGSTQSAGNGSFDINLKKLDIDGNELWSKTYGDVGFDYGKSLDLTNDGFIYITGTTNIDTVTFETDVIVIKTDLNGNEIWSMTLGGDSSDYGNFIRATEDGGCALIGNTKSFGVGGEDWYFVKLDQNGSIQAFNGSNNVSFSVYPNPTSENVNFYLQEGSACLSYTYEIFDFRGRLMHSQSETSKLVSIDVSAYGQGTYIYRISSPCMHEFRGKFIVH